MPLSRLDLPRIIETDGTPFDSVTSPAEAITLRRKMQTKLLDLVVGDLPPVEAITLRRKLQTKLSPGETAFDSVASPAEAIALCQKIQAELAPSNPEREAAAVLSVSNLCGLWAAMERLGCDAPTRSYLPWVSDADARTFAWLRGGPVVPHPEEVSELLAAAVRCLRECRWAAAANRTALSKEEREVKVRDYLKANKARAGKGELGIREASQKTGIPTPSVQRTAAWRGLQDRLEKKGRSRRPRRLKAQAFTAAMDSVAGDGHLTRLTAEQDKLARREQLAGSDNAEIARARLTAEQAADDDEVSPLDKGRRGKVRVQNQF
jgi:hypothetical protein